MAGLNGYIQFEKKLDKSNLETIVNRMNGEIRHNDSDLNINLGFDKAYFGLVDFENNSNVKNKLMIFNENKSLLLVIDGNVWGSHKLKDSLIEKDHVFNTENEEEVILHAYEEYGTECFSYFDGAFVFVIYDIIENNVIICRDRAGQKPLYYYSSQTSFIFSTQIKSLLSTKLIEKN